MGAFEAQVLVDGLYAKVEFEPMTYIIPFTATATPPTFTEGIGAFVTQESAEAFAG